MVQTPYLIQRAKIRIPVAAKNTRLSQAVDMDYMGSSEFEFGALPKSFRRIESVKSDWRCQVVESISQDGEPLQVWSTFTGEDFEKYVGYLTAFRNGKGNRTKEAVRFESSREQTSYSPNFWWDLSNDAMFGFNKQFMKRVGDYVQSSLDYMNEQK